MGQKAAPEQPVVLGLDGAARARALHPLGAAAAGPMQAQPMAACLQPPLDGAGLSGVGVGAGHVGDQQLADRQPFLDIGEIVGDRGRDLPFGQEPQQPQAGIVVVMPSIRARRKAAGNQMRTPGLCLCHRITSFAIGNCKNLTPSFSSPLVFAYPETFAPRVPISDRSQAQKTLYRGEIAIAVQQCMPPLDAKGTNNEIDRSANCKSSAAQKSIIRRGFHGQFCINQRHDFKFPQRVRDEPRFRTGA